MAEKNKNAEKKVSSAKSSGVNKKDVEMMKDWLEGLAADSFSSWDRLPDIGLYMDQVLTMMERQLAFYKRTPEDKILTQPMINNYTKDGILPRASDKKYNQNHLALLSILCSLKPVLSISDLQILLKGLHKDNEDEKNVYDFFLEIQEETISEIKEKELLLTVEKEMDEKNFSEAGHELALLALRLSVDARIRLLAAQRILDTLSEK